MTGPLAAQAPAEPFGALNWLALGLYLAGMVWIGVRCSRRIDSTEEFFLAGRRVPWWAAGLSIFGTQLSAITFMAIPAAAFTHDWVRTASSVTIMLVIPIVVVAYLPVFRRLRITTAYEFLEQRFGLPARWIAALLYVLVQFGRMGIVMYLPALALAAATGLDQYACILIMGLLCIFYTVLGGFEAVIWTDVVQVVVLVGGALIALAVAVADAGGVGELVRSGIEHDKFRVIPEDTWSLTAMSLPVAVIGFFFANLIPYTTDQAVIQRYIATPSLEAARRSLWTNFALTLPIGLVFFSLGTALFVYYDSNPELLRPHDDDQIVPWFIVHELPAGIAGLVIAAIFAASMSSLDSAMNSVSTVLVHDFYRKFQRVRNDAYELALGRWLTVVIGVLGTGTALWLASRAQDKSLFDTFNELLGFFGGALAGLFFLAVFCRSVGQRAALIGTVTGAVTVVLISLPAPEEPIVHTQMYGAVGFGASALVALAAHLVAPGRQAGSTRSTGSST